MTTPSPEPWVEKFREKFPVVNAAHESIAFFAKDLRPDIESFIHTTVLEAKKEAYESVLREIEGMTRTPRECDEKRDGNVCNGCESMMSCEMVEQDRQYNKSLSDLRDKITKL